MSDAADAKFTGSVPENYDRYLGPLARLGVARPFRTTLAALVIAAPR